MEKIRPEEITLPQRFEDKLALLRKTKPKEAEEIRHVMLETAKAALACRLEELGLNMVVLGMLHEELGVPPSATVDEEKVSVARQRVTRETEPAFRKYLMDVLEERCGLGRGY